MTDEKKQEYQTKTDEAVRDALFTILTDTLRGQTEILVLANLMKTLTGYQPQNAIVRSLELCSLGLVEAHRVLEDAGAKYIKPRYT